MSHLQISQTQWPPPHHVPAYELAGGGCICLPCTSTCVYPDTRKDIFRINNKAQNTKRRPRHRGTSAAAAVEVPRGDGDVLRVTRTHPRGMLIQRSGKNCSSSLMLRGFLTCLTGETWAGARGGGRLGHIHLTLAWDQELRLARVKLGLSRRREHF